jgi:hypothetical protein
MYIWRRTSRRQEFLPPWGTTLGETPTVGSTGRWGQVPDAAAHGGKNPSVVGHGVRTLAPWAAAAAPVYIRGRAPVAGPLTPPSKPSAFNPSEHF